MEEHVAVIFLGWQQPRKLYKLGTFGLQSLKTVWKQLRSVIRARFFQGKCVRTWLLASCYSYWPLH